MKNALYTAVPSKSWIHTEFPSNEVHIESGNRFDSIYFGVLKSPCINLERRLGSWNSFVENVLFLALSSLLPVHLLQLSIPCKNRFPIRVVPYKLLLLYNEAAQLLRYLPSHEGPYSFYIWYLQVKIKACPSVGHHALPKSIPSLQDSGRIIEDRCHELWIWTIRIHEVHSSKILMIQQGKYHHLSI